MMVKQIKRSYTVRFVTPAFLGNAEQQGQWRTPPFKALIRQWWRVVVAKTCGYDHVQVREHEGLLFGNAWLDDAFCKSQVRLRLNRWDMGRLQKSAWSGNDEKKINHSEVTSKEGKAIPVGAELYLGYGPLNYDKGQKKTALKANAAIQADDNAELHLAYPDSLTVFDEVFQLIHWFGTTGGRSHNGWGSLLLEESELRGLETVKQSNALLNKLSRPLKECLEHNRDWPHAIGKGDDDRLLIWTSKATHKSWREVMVELAKVKIAFRTQKSLEFSRNKDIKAPRLDYRHVLAYPVTHHGVEGWCEKDEITGKLKTDKQGYLKQSSRLANQLRFKVSKTAQGYIGVAYHLPCGIPNELLNALNTADRNWIVGQQLSVWRSVHGMLDKQMQRIQ